MQCLRPIAGGKASPGAAGGAPAARYRQDGAGHAAQTDRSAVAPGALPTSSLPNVAAGRAGGKRGRAGVGEAAPECARRGSSEHAAPAAHRAESERQAGASKRRRHEEREWSTLKTEGLAATAAARARAPQAAPHQTAPATAPEAGQPSRDGACAEEHKSKKRARPPEPPAVGSALSADQAPGNSMHAREHAPSAAQREPRRTRRHDARAPLRAAAGAKLPRVIRARSRQLASSRAWGAILCVRARARTALQQPPPGQTARPGGAEEGRGAKRRCRGEGPERKRLIAELARFDWLPECGGLRCWTDELRCQRGVVASIFVALACGALSILYPEPYTLNSAP